MRPDLNKLSKEIYEANIKKGWHDQEYSNEHYLCLVISELMEAVEADRKGRRAKLINNRIRDTHFELWFETNVKDTIEDELADAVIRLLDLAGVRGWAINVYSDDILRAMVLSKERTFTENIYTITRFAMESCNKSTIIKWMITYIEFLSKSLSIDLWQHVELKLEYNKTRPIKHGKRY